MDASLVNYAGTYKFPLGLSSTGNNVMDAVLAQMPLLAIGLLGPGIAAFFVALKRLNLLFWCIFASTILAFVSAILDLTLILLRAKQQQSRSLSFLVPFILLREITISLSIGLRFVFVWLFIYTLPTRGTGLDITPARPESILSLVPLQGGPRDRKRKRQPFLDLWVLLPMILAIMVFNILWRLIEQFHRRGPIYLVDNILQLVTSVIFVLSFKIREAKFDQQNRRLRLCFPPITSLLFTLALGIGNILIFAFSESIIGRFVQAMELYIFIFFIMIDVVQNMMAVSNTVITRTSESREKKDTLPTSIERLSQPGSIHSQTHDLLPRRRKIQQLTSRLTRMSSDHMSRASSWLFTNNRRRAQQSGNRTWSDDDASQRGGVSGNHAPSKIPSRESSKRDRAARPPESNATVSRFNSARSNNNGESLNARSSSGNRRSAETNSLMSYYTRWMDPNKAPSIPDVPPIPDSPALGKYFMEDHRSLFHNVSLTRRLSTPPLPPLPPQPEVSPRLEASSSPEASPDPEDSPTSEDFPNPEDSIPESSSSIEASPWSEASSDLKDFSSPQGFLILRASPSPKASPSLNVFLRPEAQQVSDEVTSKDTPPASEETLLTAESTRETSEPTLLMAPVAKQVQGNGLKVHSVGSGSNSTVRFRIAPPLRSPPPNFPPPLPPIKNGPLDMSDLSKILRSPNDSPATKAPSTFLLTLPKVGLPAMPKISASIPSSTRVGATTLARPMAGAGLPALPRNDVSEPPIPKASASPSSLEKIDATITSLWDNGANAPLRPQKRVLIHDFTPLDGLESEDAFEKPRPAPPVVPRP